MVEKVSSNRSRDDRQGLARDQANQEDGSRDCRNIAPTKRRDRVDRSRKEAESGQRSKRKCPLRAPEVECRKKRKCRQIPLPKWAPPFVTLYLISERRKKRKCLLRAPEAK